MNAIHYFAGIAIFTQTKDIWLHGKFTQKDDAALWSGSEEIYEKNQNYHFKIQGNHGMVSIRTGRDFRWKLVVIPNPSRETPLVCFVHDDSPVQRVCTDEFLMDSEVGEGAFHLVVVYQGKRYYLKMNRSKKGDPFVSLEPHEPLRRAGLVEGVVDFTFCIGQKW